MISFHQGGSARNAAHHLPGLSSQFRALSYYLLPCRCECRPVTLADQRCLGDNLGCRGRGRGRNLGCRGHGLDPDLICRSRGVSPDLVVVNALLVTTFPL